MAAQARIERFNLYRYPSDVMPNEMGEMPAPSIVNMVRKGSVIGRVTQGETIEPDVLGTAKDYGQELSSWWLGFFDMPVGFNIRLGDILISHDDARRIFQAQLVDDYPGGVRGHHIEVKLQTSSVFQNQAS
jgi:hypothetical protein